MRHLKHPNIIEFVDVFETNDKLMVVMEYAPGTELFDVILAKRRYPEDEVKIIFAQVARALYYLHSINIIHRYGMYSAGHKSCTLICSRLQRY
jgi:serine/threonine protein kinase